MENQEKARAPFRDSTLTAVVALPGGASWDLSMPEGTIGLYRTDFDHAVPRDLAPRMGDTVRLYERPPGRVEGVDLNGRQLYYRTQEETDRRDARWRAELAEQQRAQFTLERVDLDRRVAALPAPLRASIEAHRAQDPDFGWKSEALTVGIYESAAAMAAAICRENGWSMGRVDAPEARAAAQAFMNLPVSDQNARVPDPHDRRHSGASFAASCRLAYALLAGEPIA